MNMHFINKCFCLINIMTNNDFFKFIANNFAIFIIYIMNLILYKFIHMYVYLNDSAYFSYLYSKT